MNSPSTNFLVHGFDPPPEPSTPLRAGPFSLHYDHGDLRYVRLGEREVIRRIYAAVRDQSWGTIPSVISELRMEPSPLGFRIRYVREYRHDSIHFVARIELVGEADGTLRFTFDGEAKTTFLRNRIGLCVLHPLRECAGARCRVLHQDGTREQRNFPTIIAAEQPVDGLCNLAGLAHEAAPGTWIELRFTGDVFETEDQRNWIDASFKTYSTPLTLPFPVEIPAGSRIRQSVALRLIEDEGTKWEVGARKREVSRQPGPDTLTDQVQIEIPLDGWMRWPELGLGTSTHSPPFSEAEVARLVTLNLSHLRTDVYLDDPEWRPHFLAPARSANALGLPLELAVHLPKSGDPRGLFELRRELTRTRADVSRVLAFQTGAMSTTTMALAAVREYLGDLETPMGAGTPVDLYQLNLRRPPADADFIAWSMNPQVHATDNTSITETPEGALAQVASVRTYFPELPLIVSPITLKPRFHPVALNSEPSVLTCDLPPSVDPRQMTLFGAAWTVAMLAALAPSGVESLTFFEAVGWRGVMETATGSPLPEKFPSLAGSVFPLWHVFAALNGARRVLAAKSSEPHRVAAFLVSGRTSPRRVLLANLSAEPVAVQLTGIRAGFARVLEATNVTAAMQLPERWWQSPATPVARGLSLSAYAVAFVDAA